MIAKSIAKNVQIGDSYKTLANYIAAAKEKGEKLEDLWIENCYAGKEAQDLDLAIIEIEATQALNQGAYYSKAYHLTVNFPPGEKPHKDEMREIEKRFAKALGFQDHQRVCGTHQNTDHFHMHVAYNRIHPTSYKCHRPRNDYLALETTCRELEAEYGLSATKGMSDYRHYDKKSGKPQAYKQGLSEKAKDYEATTWQQSFQTHLLNHAHELIQGTQKAHNWQSFHALLEDYGAVVRLRGNGMAIYNANRKGKQEGMKLSAIRYKGDHDTKERFLSKAKLEKQLGKFEPPIAQRIQNIRSQSQQQAKPYRRQPLTKHPAQARHWKRFMRQIPKSQEVKKSLMGSAFNHWREFLMADALTDPMAMAIILYNKSMINLIMLNDPIFKRWPQTPIPFPISLEPILTHWKGKTEWKESLATKGEDIHEIIENSKLGKFGHMVDKDGNKVIPLVDYNAIAYGLEVHAPGGKVMRLGDDQKKGLMRMIYGSQPEIQPPENQQKIMIVTTEFNLASALYEATHLPVAIPENPNQIAMIANDLHKRAKIDKIIIPNHGLSPILKASLAKKPYISISTPKHIINTHTTPLNHMNKPKPHEQLDMGF